MPFEETSFLSRLVYFFFFWQSFQIEWFWKDFETIWLCKCLTGEEADELLLEWRRKLKTALGKLNECWKQKINNWKEKDLFKKCGIFQNINNFEGEKKASY